MKQLALALAAKSLWARKRRAFTTWLAIFLGVALVAGDLRPHRHDQRVLRRDLQRVAEGHGRGDHRARSRRRQDSGDGPGLPGQAAAEVRKVRRRRGSPPASIFAPGRFVEAEGRPDRPQFSPNFISSAPARTVRDARLRGRAAAAVTAREVSLDYADRRHRRPDDRRQAPARRRARGPRRYRLVGLTKLGDTRFGGAGIAQLTLPEAQRITDNEGQFDQISVAAANGVTPDRAAATRIAKVMPRQVQVETGEQTAKRQTSEIDDNLSFLPDRAARVRRRVAVRRRLPDLQHVLDHGRPAHARVRDAAHARRVAAADPHLGGGRGAGARAARGGRSGCSAALPSPTGSTSCSRRSASTCRTPAGDRDPDGDRLAADRGRG